MTFTSAESLFEHLVELGTRGDNPQAPTKHLTLFDAHRREHYLSDLDSAKLSDPEFAEHLERIFKRPKGGHVVCRMAQRPHVAGRSGKLAVVPDRVAIFTISSGRAVQLSPREVAISQGRLTPGEAEDFGSPRWRKERSKPQNAMMEAV